MVKLSLAFAQDLGEHLKQILALGIALVHPRYNRVLRMVTLPTLLWLRLNIIWCRSAEAEPHRRMTVRPVLWTVLQACLTRRLWVRARIRTMMLLGTWFLLTSRWMKLKLARDVDGKLILTLPHFTCMSNLNTCSPWVGSTGLTSVRPLLCRLMVY